MISRSQNGEDLFVSNYFAGKTISALSIGENNGVDLSNVRGMIESGQIISAHLVEPGSVYSDLHALYVDSPNIHTHNFGIGEEEKVVKFYESGAHVAGGTDQGLVSTVNEAETVRWRLAGVEFKETEIYIINWPDFYTSIGSPKFDFVSIDVEGLEWSILKQMDLTAIGCSCLCIEYNGHLDLKMQFVSYCEMFGMRLALQNNENLLFCK